MCVLPFVRGARVAQRCCAIDRDRAAVVTTAVLSIVATAAPTKCGGLSNATCAANSMRLRLKSPATGS